MKRKAGLTILMSLVVLFESIGNVQAKIIPPYGEGQSGLEAVVLCQSLTVRQEASASSRALQTLPYGRRFSVISRSGKWAKCILSDDVNASPAGWVNGEFIVTDPAWYRTEGQTVAYAWNDMQKAPKLALLENNTLLPIVKDEGDWVIVSLRGGAGWIHKTASDKAAGEVVKPSAQDPTEQSAENPTKQPAENPTEKTTEESKEKPEESSDPKEVSYKNGSYALSDNGTATFLKAGKSAKTFEVRDTIKVNGKTYKVTAVASKAFYKNKKLTEVTIGKNVKTIGKYAFASCTKLTSAALGSGLKTISDKAFYKCTALTKITIPSKVTEIGKSAFRGCGKLKGITIKTKKLKEKKVGSKAFAGTAETATVKVPRKYLNSYKKWLVKRGISLKAKIRS